jgi:ribose transport system permease protein
LEDVESILIARDFDAGFPMKQQLGILGLLIVVCLGTAVANPSFLELSNIGNVAKWGSMYSILSIGMAFVIIGGGIDLSVGSVGGLIGCAVGLMLPWCVVNGLHPWMAVLMGLAIAAVAGLAHGLLITKVRLQPFIVTLCGLMIYRSAARSFTKDNTIGFAKFDSLRWFAIGKVDPLGWICETCGMTWAANPDIPDVLTPMVSVPLPVPLFIMTAIAILAAVFLNLTVFGRHLQALGRNEQAAKFSGINTDRVVIASYVICSFLAGVGGILMSLDVNSIQPSGNGEGWELYAIAGAVLGGCSLRGGQGSILGVVIGATLIRAIYNSINVLGLRDVWEFGIIGLVILGGVAADEIVHRLAARRRLLASAKAANG